MKATTEQVKIGIQKYIDKELNPKLTGWKGVGIRVILGLGAETIAEAYLNHPMLETIGIKDAEGLEIDRLHDVLRKEVEKEGKVNVAGILFDATDVDKLYNEIIAAKGGNII